MKTLYIHGLDGFPVPQKTTIMQEAGLDVTALHIDYRQKLGVYETLKDTALRKNIEFIIGSSLGGYIGNVIAEDLGLPCLLFNPAMNYTDVFYSKIPAIKKPACRKRFIVLGYLDESSNPNYTLKIFQQKERKSIDQRIVICHWLGHEIDFRTFDEMVHWAVRGLGKK